MMTSTVSSKDTCMDGSMYVAEIPIPILYILHILDNLYRSRDDIKINYARLLSVHIQTTMYWRHRIVGK